MLRVDNVTDATRLGLLNEQLKFHGALYQNSVQSIVDSTWTVVDPNSTKAFDTDDFYDSVNKGYKIQKGISYICVHGAVLWTGNRTGRRRLRIRKNGGDYVGSSITEDCVPGSDDFYSHIVNFLTVVKDDYITLEVWQTTGGNLNILATQAAFFGFYVLG